MGTIPNFFSSYFFHSSSVGFYWPCLLLLKNNKNNNNNKTDCVWSVWLPPMWLLRMKGASLPLISMLGGLTGARLRFLVSAKRYLQLFFLSLTPLNYVLWKEMIYYCQDILTQNAQFLESNSALCKVCTNDASYVVRWKTFPITIFFMLQRFLLFTFFLFPCINLKACSCFWQVLRERVALGSEWQINQATRIA